MWGSTVFISYSLESWEAGGVGRGGFRTTRMVPSQELEQKLSFDTRFQCTANTSRMCSFQD